MSTKHMILFRPSEFFQLFQAVLLRETGEEKGRTTSILTAKNQDGSLFTGAQNIHTRCVSQQQELRTEGRHISTSDVHPDEATEWTLSAIRTRQLCVSREDVASQLKKAREASRRAGRTVHVLPQEWRRAVSTAH